MALPEGRKVIVEMAAAHKWDAQPRGPEQGQGLQQPSVVLVLPCLRRIENERVWQAIPFGHAGEGNSAAAVRGSNERRQRHDPDHVGR